MDDAEFKIVAEPDKEGILTCMEGPASGANFKPSVDGNCAECGQAIHWSASIPSYLRKMCRCCTLALIEEKGETPSMALTEATIKETFAKLGIRDTPEARAKALELSKENWMAWLKQGKSKDSAWGGDRV